MKIKILLYVVFIGITISSLSAQTRLVWSNNTKHTISSCNLEGTDLRDILVTNSPVDLVFFEKNNEIYFTDASKQAIYAFNVETNNRRLVIDVLV